MFFFEKWKVYILACELAAIIEQLALGAPRGFGPRLDQLRRTVASVISNIGEGALRTSKAAKIQFYEIARGAAGECAALLISFRYSHPNKILVERGIDVADHVCALLTNLIKSVENRPE